MKTIPDLMKEFERSAGKLIKGLNQLPKNDPRYKDVWEYKCKIQNLLGEWQKLLKTWGENEELKNLN